MRPTSKLGEAIGAVSSCQRFVRILCKQQSTFWGLLVFGVLQECAVLARRNFARILYIADINER
jgi:hypothetical protein